MLKRRAHLQTVLIVLDRQISPYGRLQGTAYVNTFDDFAIIPDFHAMLCEGDVGRLGSRGDLREQADRQADLKSLLIYHRRRPTCPDGRLTVTEAQPTACAGVTHLELERGFEEDDH